MFKLSVFAVRRALPVVAVWAGVSALSACSSVQSATSALPAVQSLVTPYRMDILQGNFVSREQAAALAPGMPRAQVRDMLGTPLLASVFHADRWDYAFTFSRPGLAPQKRKLTVFFKGDVLERVESDELPTEAEFVASLESRKRLAPVPVLEASEQALKAFAERNAANAAPQPPAPVPPIANYPPLEPVATGAAR